MIKGLQLEVLCIWYSRFLWRVNPALLARRKPLQRKNMSDALVNLANFFPALISSISQADLAYS